jgi:polyhydroxyalkanoate synthase
VNEHVSGTKRFVLSSSGHILGIVNPVVTPPKRKFWVGEAQRHQTPEEWRRLALEQSGTWWQDWVAWLKPRSGELLPARPIDTPQYPTLGDAPGSYVLE